MRASFAWWLWVLVFFNVVADADAGAEPADAPLVSADSDAFLVSDFSQRVARRGEFRIAVLPVENHSVAADAGALLRLEFQQRLTAKGYSMVALDAIDRSLNSLGVSHPGQVALLPFEDLATAVRADAILSALVEQATVQRAGVYSAHVYTISAKLQASPSSELLWSALTERVAQRRFALDPANALIDALLVGRVRPADALAFLTDRVLESLPDGPAVVTVGDPLLRQAIQIQVVQ